MEKNELRVGIPRAAGIEKNIRATIIPPYPQFKDFEELIENFKTYNSTCIQAIEHGDDEMYDKNYLAMKQTCSVLHHLYIIAPPKMKKPIVDIIDILVDKFDFIIKNKKKSEILRSFS